MRPRRVLPKADADIDATADYYAVEAGTEIAFRFLGAVEQAYEFISRTPEAGSLCRYDSPLLEGLRRWPFPGFGNHLVFYRLAGDWVEIVRVLHGARDIESLLEGDAESE